MKRSGFAKDNSQVAGDIFRLTGKDDERSHKRMPAPADKVKPALEEELRKSVDAMRDKLAVIRIGVNSALELSAPDENGDYANLGRCYRGLSMAIAAIRETVGPAELKNEE